jgi:hypothetical protein
MPVGGRSAFGANAELRPIALALVYLPETVGKCRRGRFRVGAERNEKLKSKVDKTVTLKLH